jgi:biopolymer transport protein ExbD
MRLVRRHRPGPYVPFISLADIAWQIIIFFLLASSFAGTRALKIPLPGGTAQASAAPSNDNNTITIDASEQALFVNGQVVTPDTLQSQLANLLSNAKTDEQRVVSLRASDDLTFQRNADIMYAIQQAGGTVMISERERP